VADPSNAEDVARWACGITLGLNGPMTDTFDTTAYFATEDHQYFYASVFNQATAYQIQQYSSFNWKCCLGAADLKPITSGKALVVLIESHLLPKTTQAQLVSQPATLWHVGGTGQ
jgi:hypothetical protein